jgi:L-seryl-tRNA(Ser) seleniumtransferase
LNAIRTAVAKEGEVVPAFDLLVARIVDRAHRLDTPFFKRVINATGVVLHTNLGRAPLGTAAQEAIASVAAGYANVEFRLSDGARGDRLDAVRDHLCALTGAEDALAVNNNAGAVLLAMNALARGREVIVSRGESVEIGGSFRVPEVVTASGGRLVEVGTTNRTRVGDYSAAITDDTAALLRVHPSNFRVIGFTERPEREALVALARKAKLPLVEDLGSGNIVEGLVEEPTVAAVVSEGVDLVTFSGDKLLGGPQAGFVVGRKAWVAKLRKHPLYRALRLDKLTLAGAEATLRVLRHHDVAQIPTVAMLSSDPEGLFTRAKCMVDDLGLTEVSVAELDGRVGAGAMPEQPLNGYGIEIRATDPLAFQSALRANETPVIARVHDHVVLLDLRTVDPEDDARVTEAVRLAVEGIPSCE